MYDLGVFECRMGVSIPTAVEVSVICLAPSTPIKQWYQMSNQGMKALN